MTGTRSRYADRIASLAAEARVARKRFDPDSLRDDDGNESGNADGASERANDRSQHAEVALAGTGVSTLAEAALVAARDGLGPVVGVYVEARTADEPVRFSGRELDRLHAATSDWLAVYARCRGVAADPDATVREAAELLVDTHDITDVAALLTGTHRDDS
ncbi:hypothetical protein [Halorubrum sp. Boch-26]|uniref:hypothetical protein n=1 Tax=Halorubrum sp. Boch-26 TaxID=2994426 RepID=UPI00246984A4|nr:hypothetical protein [Halorubrum sp. Boch-26]